MYYGTCLAFHTTFKICVLGVISSLFLQQKWHQVPNSEKFPIGNSKYRNSHIIFRVFQVTPSYELVFLMFRPKL